MPTTSTPAAICSCGHAARYHRDDFGHDGCAIYVGFGICQCTLTVEEAIAESAAVDGCVCPPSCDCQNPEPPTGTAGVSMACPVHNIDPWPVEGCEADRHVGGQQYTTRSTR